MIPAVAQQPVPLTVVGGFLGSGKTTLINRILSSQLGLRTAVLVNDFGAVNIDARLIASDGGQTIALTNGCVCCSIGDDLTDALIRVVQMQPAPDWIVIEASGVSDPRKIAEVGLIDSTLVLDGVAVVADASSIQDYAARPALADTVLRQLAAADVLLVNKIDLIDKQQRDCVETWLTAQIPGVPLYGTENAQIPLALITGVSLHPRPQCANSKPAETMHRHPFSTWTFQTEAVFSATRLRTLLAAMPEGIVRAKGIVRTDGAVGRESVLQFAGRSRLLRAGGPWQGGASQIVFIGASADVAFAEIESRLQAALVHD